jgi:hypothetical protein
VAELRPVALPPAERTVGQLVAETVRFYGDHFWKVVGLGVAPASFAVVTANVPHHITEILSPTLFGALLSATFVAACVIALETRPSNGRLVQAWVVGWIVLQPVLVPVPYLIFAGAVWLLCLALVIPVLVVEKEGVWASVVRALRLARSDWVHQVGTIVTLVVVVLLSQGVLAFALRDFGGTAISIAFFLASTVVSPLLFIGTALLYVDQAARVKVD